MPKWSNSRKAALKQRLRKRIEKQDKPNGCWLWTGARTADGHGAIHVCWLWQGDTKKGYGCIVIANHRCAVHRVAYELWAEPIPKGLQVQHLCSNQRCCNPAHLVAGTASENARHLIECRRRASMRSIGSGGIMGEAERALMPLDSPEHPPV